MRCATIPSNGPISSPRRRPRSCRSSGRAIPDREVFAAERRLLAILPPGFDEDFQKVADASLEHNLALIFAAFEFGRQVGAVRSRRSSTQTP
jgi:hypothetical protein